MSRFVDSIIAYRILTMLVTPFNQTEAFKQGIIDKNGKELMRMDQLHTVAQRDAYSILHRMVFRIKRIIEKVPTENKKLVSFAAALSLVKEHQEKEPIDLEKQFVTRMSADLTEELIVTEKFINDKYLVPFKLFIEDAPANSASATPGIDGLPPDPTVPVKQPNKLVRRKPVFLTKEIKWKKPENK